jgi:AcrR family transcriptional regulator
MIMADHAKTPKRAKRQKRERLSRETIAQTALELIDREGLDALSMRRVAAELNVDPMALYRSVRDRDDLISDIVARLLDEMDTTEQPGETWIQTMTRMALSEREMALRHPRAFPLVAVTPTAEGPALAHARRTMRVVVKSGLPEHLFSDVWLVDDAFTTGFLLIETTTICREMDSGSQPRIDDSDDELPGIMAATLTGEAFARGLDLVYEGLRTTFARELGASSSESSTADGA